MKRVALLVYVDLDPVPGPFHTEDSALNNLRGILEDQINHYNPVVAFAPDPYQPRVDDETLAQFHELRHGAFRGAGWQFQVTEAAWNIATTLDDQRYPEKAPQSTTNDPKETTNK